MTDSSSEEDLSRFQDAVDETFVKLLNANTINKYPSLSETTDRKPQSQRYLEESTHYNDVKVSEELQKKIGAKMSEIINKNLKFVNVDSCVKKRRIKGGVKLFKDSEGFLSCEDFKDTYTEQHNNLSRKIKCKRRQVEGDSETTDEAKIKSVAVCGEYVLSKEETRHWESRRKEKIFKYKENRGNSILTALE